MSEHHPISELLRDFPKERLERIKLGSERLEVKIQISRAIGEELLRENNELPDLLCEAELDFSDKELVQAIEDQIAAVEGTERAFTPEQQRHIKELTNKVHGWIALNESVKV